MEFQSHIVVTSQSTNKKFGPPNPLLLCLQASKCPTLLKQLCPHLPSQSPPPPGPPEITEKTEQQDYFYMFVYCCDRNL